MHAYMLSHVRLFAILWTIACQAPLPMGFPGKNTGVGCYFLLQGTLSSQGLNPFLFCLLYWQVDSLPAESLGSPQPTKWWFCFPTSHTESQLPNTGTSAYVHEEKASILPEGTESFKAACQHCRNTTNNYKMICTHGCVCVCAFVYQISEHYFQKWIYRQFLFFS